MTNTCPICGNPATDRTRPFCSPRCGDIDLGRWLTAQYVVPGPPDAAAPDSLLDHPEPVE